MTDNGIFHFLSVQGDGRKKFRSIFALDFSDMNILSPGKQLGEFSVSLEFIQNYVASLRALSSANANGCKVFLKDGGGIFCRLNNSAWKKFPGMFSPRKTHLKK